MTFDERIFFLKQQRRNNHLASLNLSADAREAAYTRLIQADAAEYNRTEQFFAEYAQNTSPARVRELRREYKAKELQSLGFVSYVLYLDGNVMFYMAENDEAVKTANYHIVNLLATIPGADLYAFEQEFHFFITRLETVKDEPPTDGLPIGEALD